MENTRSKWKMMDLNRNQNLSKIKYPRLSYCTRCSELWYLQQLKIHLERKSSHLHLHVLSARKNWYKSTKNVSCWNITTKRLFRKYKPYVDADTFDMQKHIFKLEFSTSKYLVNICKFRLGKEKLILFQVHFIFFRLLYSYAIYNMNQIRNFKLFP